jgi:hypothetical protein
MWVVTVPEDVAGIFRIDRLIKAAIFLSMETFDQAPLILAMMQDPKSLKLC